MQPAAVHPESEAHGEIVAATVYPFSVATVSSTTIEIASSVVVKPYTLCPSTPDRWKTLSSLNPALNESAGITGGAGGGAGSLDVHR